MKIFTRLLSWVKNLHFVLSILLLVFGIFLIGIQKAEASDDFWAIKASVPSWFGDGRAALVNGKIYVAGGNESTSNYEYDPAANTWTVKSPMPVVRSNHAIGVVNNKIYVIGGSDCESCVPHLTSTVYEYDTAADIWSAKSPMPGGPRILAAYAVVNNQIYVFGGRTPTNISVSRVERYDPSTDSWTTLPNMPFNRVLFSASEFNNKIYLFGGFDEYTNKVSTVHEYDPLTNVWTVKQNIPDIRYGLSSVTGDNGRIYAIGGQNNSGVQTSTTYEYNPVTDVWYNRASMISTRSRFAAAKAGNGKIYVFDSNTEEYTLHNVVGEEDKDGDGCSDLEEVGSNPVIGGDRNPNYKWDFFDVNGDKSIDLSDTLLILDHFGQNPDDPGYDQKYDRDAPDSSKPYKTVASSSGIDLTDALANLASFGHSCAGTQ